MRDNNRFVLGAFAFLCAVIANSAQAGSLVSWGNNLNSQISSTPVESGITAIAVGHGHSHALTANGSIISWGKDSDGQVSDTPPGAGHTAIAAGDGHVIALTASGTILVWGREDHGQITNAPTGSGFTAIDAGGSFCLALRDNGSIVAWGQDNHNQVSDAPNSTGFTAISAGNWHGLALTANGSITAWGWDDVQAVSSTPGDSGYTAISAGDRHSLALRSDKSIAAWGWDDDGAVSDAPTDPNFTAIQTANRYGLALRDDGTITAWGRDDFGRVSSTPMESGFTAIAAKDLHSLALGPSITVLEPNGNQRLREGNQFVIEWAGGFDGNWVRIEYSGNSGINWETIATVQGVDSYDWQIITGLSRESLVRISDVTYPTIGDTSDDTFQVFSCKNELIGDLNRDCRVDLLDFLLTAQSWLHETEMVIYYFPLNATPGWSVDGEWQFGVPTGNGGTSLGYPDPYGGYSGTNAYGVDLNGDFTIAVGEPNYLSAGPFDCSGFENMKLAFARWLNTDLPSYIHNTIQASNDGLIWETVWENAAEVTDSTWNLVEYDISAVADNQSLLYIRWGYEILDDRAFLSSGWNIDDIQLRGNPASVP